MFSFFDWFGNVYVIEYFTNDCLSYFLNLSLQAHLSYNAVITSSRARHYNWVLFPISCSYLGTENYFLYFFKHNKCKTHLCHTFSPKKGNLFKNKSSPPCYFP